MCLVEGGWCNYPEDRFAVLMWECHVVQLEDWACFFCTTSSLGHTHFWSFPLEQGLLLQRNNLLFNGDLNGDFCGLLFRSSGFSDHRHGVEKLAWELAVRFLLQTFGFNDLYFCCGLGSKYCMIYFAGVIGLLGSCLGQMSLEDLISYFVVPSPHGVVVTSHQNKCNQKWSDHNEVKTTPGPFFLCFLLGSNLVCSSNWWAEHKFQIFCLVGWLQLTNKTKTKKICAQFLMLLSDFLDQGSFFQIQPGEIRANWHFTNPFSLFWKAEADKSSFECLLPFYFHIRLVRNSSIPWGPSGRSDDLFWGKKSHF